MHSYVLIRRHFLAGKSCSSLVATASNSSIVCATSASSTRLSRVLAVAAVADNDSPDTAPRIRRWSRKSWWSFARPDLRLLARRCATILVASTPPTWSPAKETVWVQRPGDLILVSAFSAVVLVRMFPRSPARFYYRGCRGESYFRVRVLLHDNRRFVQPMLHTYICTYTPGRSGGRHSFNACTSHVPAEI